ncbi:MAG: T9SS type A sorting domain-containing protein, partial [Chitinophagales bacterium]
IVSFEEINAVISIIDITGRIVSVTETTVNGNGSLSLDVNHIADGAYNISISTNDKTINKRFVKQ